MSRDYRGGNLSLPRRVTGGRETQPYDLADDIVPMTCPMKTLPMENVRNSSVPGADDMDYHSNPDITMKSTKIQNMKNKLDELEPRINSIGEQMQRVADDMSKFRELLTSRRREMEELERNVGDRICRTEQRLQQQTRELGDYKTDCATDNAALRQTVDNLCQEVNCLRNWVLENLKQINAKLDGKDKEYCSFKSNAFQRLRASEQGLSSKGNDVHCFRAEVEARFTALKDALSMTLKRPPGCEPMLDETVTDTMITTIQDDGYDRSRSGTLKKSAGADQRGTFPKDPGRRSTARESTDTNGAADHLVSEVVHRAETALDQMKRDTLKLQSPNNV